MAREGVEAASQGDDLAGFFHFGAGGSEEFSSLLMFLFPAEKFFNCFGGPWIESFRGRENGEERVVVPTRGLRSRDKSGTYNAVILARRGQAGEGLPLVYSIHGAPNGGC